MGEIRAEMAKAAEASAIQLAHLRGCSKVDAARSVAQTYAENLRDSRGTTMEDYWRSMSEVADQVVADAMRDAEH